MRSNPSTCNPHRIELFLDQKLSDAEQAAFELHLDDCRDCRRQLETSAAGDDAWSAVRDSLRDAPLPSDDPHNDDSALDSVGEVASSSQATVLKLLAPTDDDRMIGRWGTYEVVGVVGTSGMGVVLKAFDAALNRYVAIKILAPHLGTSGAARKRFAREAQAAAAVVHDNVIEIHGVAEAAGLPYLVMPYVRGPSLQRRLHDEGPLAVVEILRVAMQAAAGLAAAHAQGLVHRDVKPANILLADGIERVKLTDFGLARAADDASLTRTGVIAGTPQYMSPEQARGEPVDPRSDLFSLGSVLYAMSTGRPPFRAETSYGVLRRITDEEPRPIREINPDIPEWLCGIVAKLMAKRPDDRFQSAHEVAALLEQCLAHVQQPTVVPLPTFSPLLPGEGQGVRAAPRSLRHRPRLLKGTLAMLTLLGISLFAVGVVSTTPPNISGNWQGEDWGQVTITQTAPGEYTGTYTDTVAKEKGPGKIDLKWSRIERRFNGTWREGDDDRFGELSIRLMDKEIRGALTTDPKSKINPATPRLSDLVWRPKGKTLLELAEPDGDHPPAPVVAPDSGIAWGTAVDDVQLGIRFNFANVAQRREYRYGDLFGVEIFSRNTGTRANKYPMFTGGAWFPQISGGSISLPGLVIANGCISSNENQMDPGASARVDGVAMLIAPSGWLGDPNYHSVLRVDPGTYKLFYEDAARKSGILPITIVPPTQDEVNEFRRKHPWKEQPSAKNNSGTVPPPLVPASENILKNSGAEAGKATPDDWQQGAAVDGVSYSWCKSTAFDGKASLCIERTAEGYYPIAQWSQTVDRMAGRSELLVSAQVKALNLTHAVLDVAFLGPRGEVISSQPAAFIGSSGPNGWPANHDWKQYSGKVRIPPQTRKLRIALQLIGPGKVWFDDIRAAYSEAEKTPGTASSHPRATQFDGNHYAKVEPRPKFTSGDFTISLWFNPVRSGDWALPFMRGFGWRDQRGDIGFQFNRDSGDLGFAATGEDYSGDENGSSSGWIFGWGALESRLRSPVRYGQWNHAAVTRRGDTYTIWMNGRRVVTEKSAADISDAGNTNPFIVGGMMHKQGVRTMYQGALDDFRIFRRCLSDKEIDDLYKVGGDESFMHGEGRVKIGPMIEQPKRSPATKSPFEARLPNGIAVELYGVSENPSKDRAWWRPDGSPLDKRPYETMGPAASAPGGIIRELAILLKHLPQEPVDLRVEFDPPCQVRPEPNPRSLLPVEGEPGALPRTFVAQKTNLLAYALTWPTVTKTATVRVGIAPGPWKTLTETNGGLSATDLPGGLRIVFASPYEENGRVVITATHTSKNSEVRVVAVGKDGREHTPDESAAGGAANVMQLTVEFAKLSLRDIASFRFQWRPYEWIEFRNVSLHAGEKTDVQVVQPPSDASAPAKQ